MLVDALLGRVPPRSLTGRHRAPRRTDAPALTRRQAQVLAFVARHIELHSMPPTLRAIAAELGTTSTNGPNDHLNALERKGYIERSPLISRGIRLTAAGKQWRRR